MKMKQKKHAFLMFLLQGSFDRLLGEKGRADMFKLIYHASKKGGKLARKWYKEPNNIISIISLILWVSIAIKVYFF